MKTIDKEEIFSENIGSTLIKLSIPLIVSDLVQVIYNFVDTFWLSRLGTEALSAPVVSWPPVYFLISFGAGLLSSGIATISQDYGKGDYESAREYSGVLFLFTLVFSLIVSVIPAIFSYYILKIMNIPEDLIPFANIYLRTILLATPFAYIGITFTTITSALGDVGLTMKINLLSVVINVILDPFMIFGIYPFPKMGVFGSALATLVSEVVVAIYSIFMLFYKYKKLNIGVKDLKFDMKWLKEIFRIGVPLGIHRSSNSLAQTFSISLLSFYGADVIAAYGITTRIIDFVQSITTGYARATAIMVGANLGRKFIDRSKEVVKKSLLDLSLILVFIGVILVLFRDQLIGIFTQDPSVFKYAVDYLFISSITLPFYGWFFISYGVANGSGNTYFFGLLSVLRMWVFRILPMFICIYILTFNVIYIWLVIAVSNIISGITGLMWVNKKTWIVIK
ncbi:MATE family efflux transporter [Fervidicoccus sp.]|uniref:MATE family efflux transporter n=1 Tax=Fervidicoccus sp. TaxID=2060324 RepID=UPI003D10EF9B